MVAIAIAGGCDTPELSSRETHLENAAMTTSPSLAPQAVQNAIDEYEGELGQYFRQNNLTYTVTCDVEAATSVDNVIWSAGVQPDQTTFVGSAIKTFILAEYLRQGLSETTPMTIDDGIRSVSSTVFGDETFGGEPDPDLKLDGQTLARNVLEAMISHSDNTATDATLAAVGVDNVRDLINEVGLPSVVIPDSTRQLFAYLASGQNVDVDWQTLQQYVDNPPDPQPAINDQQSMLASASDMVRWYQTALLEPGFFTAGELTEFKRISGMADALSRIVPDNLISYGKGGSITWNNFGALTVSAQMIMPTTDPAQPWVPLTFSFDVNWGSSDLATFGAVAGIFTHTLQDVLAASLDAFYPVYSVDYSTAVGGVYVDLAAQFTEHAPARQGWSGGPGSVTPVSTDHLSGIQTVIGSSFDDLLVGGTLSGGLSGGAGNDMIYGNTSQATADNASWLTLDGGAGNNALYGSSGFNTFLASDTNGGFNQIWGAASKMDGVSGYANNTLSFENVATGKSVYVDLLNGRNAYINSGSQNNGTYTLEDSISNVPNVIGSSGGDVLIADNGTDRITGGTGADQLYAGSGPDTFIYTAYSDSNLVAGYDAIYGFKTGTDKVDLSALHSDASHLLIQTSGTTNSVYLEATPGAFNAGTDLAMVINTAAAGGARASDFVF
jgi:beta-lactamase class A